MLKIKLLAVFAFLAVAAGAVLFGNNETQAQTGQTGARRDEVLEKVAAYKGWKQVQKPAKESLNILETGVLKISDSSPAG